MWEHLQKPYAQITWTYITDVMVIESILTKWQHYHYTQTNDTPLANNAWCNPKDPTTIKTGWIDSILRDTLDQDEDLSSASKALL